MVQMSAARVLDGSQDVLATLRAIPDERVALMQRTIADHAHELHYGYDDFPGDGVHVLLRTLVSRARTQIDSQRP